jgi:ferrous iron transport protein A
MIISRIMDMSRSIVPALDLVSLPRRQPATVAAIDWARLAQPASGG